MFPLGLRSWLLLHMEPLHQRGSVASKMAHGLSENSSCPPENGLRCQPEALVPLHVTLIHGTVWTFSKPEEPGSKYKCPRRKAVNTGRLLRPDLGASTLGFLQHLALPEALGEAVDPAAWWGDGTVCLICSSPLSGWTERSEWIIYIPPLWKINPISPKTHDSFIPRSVSPIRWANLKLLGESQLNIISLISKVMKVHFCPLLMLSSSFKQLIFCILFIVYCCFGNIGSVNAIQFITVGNRAPCLYLKIFIRGKITTNQSNII